MNTLECRVLSPEWINPLFSGWQTLNARKPFDDKQWCRSVFCTSKEPHCGHVSLFLTQSNTVWLYSLFFFEGDQNAINDLMQMRLSAGGGGGMMAEKLEVSSVGFLKAVMSQNCTCIHGARVFQVSTWLLLVFMASPHGSASYVLKMS